MAARVVLACLWLCAFPALAEVIPFGDPPAERLKAVPEAGFTLNEAKLKRYGYTREGYDALAPGERGRVSSWIKILEWESELEERRTSFKLRGSLMPPLVLVPLLPPSVVASSATPKWTPAEEASIARIKTEAGGGAAFDGSAPPGPRVPGVYVPYFTPNLELFGGALPMDGSRPDGLGVRRFYLTTPDGLRLEVGNLGLDGRSPLIAPSPYFNAYKTWEGSGSALDYGSKLQVGAINLGARLYYDYGPLDARIDKGFATLNELNHLGLRADKVDDLQKEFSFSTDFERQWLFIGSWQGWFGRAAELYNKNGYKIAAGFSNMALLRVTHFFPNAALDQTGGLRFTFPGNQNIGVFAGVTEGLRLIGPTAVSDSLEARKLKTDLGVDVAPHQTLIAWGKMPYLSGVEYTASAGVQWNPWTTVKQVSGGLAKDLPGGAKVGVYGGYEDESGLDGAYQRRKASAGVTYNPFPNVGIFGQYSDEKFVYGTAAVDNHAVIFGITATEGTPGGGSVGSVTMTSLFGGQDHLVTRATSAKVVQDVQDALDLVRRVKDTLLGRVGGPEQAWRDIQGGWSRLDPRIKDLLRMAYGVANPGGPSLDDIIGTKPSTWGDLNRLANFLGDTDVIERLMVRFIRHRILEELKSVEIPVLGKIRMSAPMVLAAAHAYSLSLTPVPPITDKDRGALDGYILNEVSKQFGCSKGPQPQSTTDCILATLPEPERTRLKNLYGDDINKILKAAVSWPSDVIQREMNALALQVILAAERLNELTVDEGKRIGDMNVRALMTSFSYLDERSRKEQARTLKAARQDIEEDLAAIDARMRVTLQEYGAGRLAWLKQEPSWPQGVDVSVREQDWAGLLAIYGDKALFDLILRCKGKLASRPAGALGFKNSSRSVVIMLDVPSALNATTTIVGDPTVIKLPARGSDLSLYQPDF